MNKTLWKLIFKCISGIQKKEIATNIILELEKAALHKGTKTIGIGVGLFKDYGNDQRLYMRLRYIPDGNGIQYDGQPC
ncbi:MAG: hypothetical protein ACO1OT_12535 [Heyndrickxia sp.]